MHFEFLVEEPSAGKALHNLLPQIITGDHTFRIISYQGKKDLLSKLPIELKGYSRWIDEGFKIVVLIDRDNSDCHVLKKIMELSATDAGLRKTEAAAEISSHMQPLRNRSKSFQVFWEDITHCLSN